MEVEPVREAVMEVEEHREGEKVLHTVGEEETQRVEERVTVGVPVGQVDWVRDTVGELQWEGEVEREGGMLNVVDGVPVAESVLLWEAERVKEPVGQSVEECVGDTEEDRDPEALGQEEEEDEGKGERVRDEEPQGLGVSDGDTLKVALPEAEGEALGDCDVNTVGVTEGQPLSEGVREVERQEDTVQDTLPQALAVDDTEKDLVAVPQALAEGVRVMPLAVREPLSVLLTLEQLLPLAESVGEREAQDVNDEVWLRE